jgi:hypothetical protein
MEKKQSTNMSISPFDDAKSWYFGTALQDGGEQTFNLSNKDVHTSIIQPAPNPVKLDPHISPLVGEITSTPMSNFLFDLYSDAVDRAPIVKQFSATVAWNDCMEGFQDQVETCGRKGRKSENNLLVITSLVSQQPLIQFKPSYQS